MNTATTTLTLNKGFLSRHNWFDWLFAATVVAGGLFAFSRYGAYMDVYEKGILLAAMPAMIWLGWFWRPLRVLLLAVAGFALLAIALYQTDGQGSLARADNVFWLKYFLSSQSAILWMSMLFFMSTLFYWLGMFARGEGRTMELMGSRIAWVAVGMALTGTLVRWYESYLIGADIGHIPVSNLYEVFVLFCWLTAAFYLYFEDQYQTRALGAFVMLVVSAAVGFLLWYTVVREAHEIQPLVPALKSWWMKLHVPANFIGYGTFALSAMVAFAFLIVPTLLHRSKSGLSARDKTTRTIDAMRLIDAGEQDYKTGHGRYTQHLADLVSANAKLAGDLAVGLDVRLDVSTNGNSYLAQVASDVLSLVRARTGTTGFLVLLLPLALLDAWRRGLLRA